MAKGSRRVRGFFVCINVALPVLLSCKNTTYRGFWSPMDNMHDREYLENLWNTGKAPWNV